MGDDDDNGGSRPDTSAATMQAFLNEGRGTEDGVAEQVPPGNEEEAKENEEETTRMEKRQRGMKKRQKRIKKTQRRR